MRLRDEIQLKLNTYVDFSLHVEGTIRTPTAPRTTFPRTSIRPGKLGCFVTKVAGMEMQRPREASSRGRIILFF
jgi:hypothetical protein